MKALFDIACTLKKIRSSFQALRKEGINARMNFGCCQECAMTSAPFLTSTVYFHQEDGKNFNSTGVLFIRFLSGDGDRNSTRALGDQVRCILELHGLEVEWSGRPDQPVMVMA
jgi:hypothetical protein